MGTACSCFARHAQFKPIDDKAAYGLCFILLSSLSFISVLPRRPASPIVLKGELKTALDGMRQVWVGEDNPLSMRQLTLIHEHIFALQMRSPLHVVPRSKLPPRPGLLGLLIARKPIWLPLHLRTPSDPASPHAAFLEEIRPQGLTLHDFEAKLAQLEALRGSISLAVFKRGDCNSSAHRFTFRFIVLTASLETWVFEFPIRASP